MSIVRAIEQKPSPIFIGTPCTKHQTSLKWCQTGLILVHLGVPHARLFSALTCFISMDGKGAEGGIRPSPRVSRFNPDIFGKKTKSKKIYHYSSQGLGIITTLKEFYICLKMWDI